jgi:hypothetical protein
MPTTDTLTTTPDATTTATSPHPRDWGRALAEALCRLSSAHGGTRDQAAPALLERGVHLDVRPHGTGVELTASLLADTAAGAVRTAKPAA